ncbi:hypothetical protein LS684_13790 [Cytobacillus spongiae]|nr:hypothetical protein LS684_13790 [Cytobacillus spongiae]
MSIIFWGEALTFLKGIGILFIISDKQPSQLFFFFSRVKLIAPAVSTIRTPSLGLQDLDYQTPSPSPLYPINWSRSLFLLVFFMYRMIVAYQSNRPYFFL